MNKQEKALEILKGLELTTGNSNILKEPLQLAISALEKQIPKLPEEKILIRQDNYNDGTNIPRYDWWCSNCHSETMGTNLIYYCPTCGQSIDWRNEDE